MPTAVVHRRANRCQHGWVSHPVAMEVADINDALTLWRRLVSRAIGRPQPPAVAVDAFRRLHRGGAAGALDSALLLCTDRQWHTASAKVIAGIVDSGILDDDDQDWLADALLWHEQLHYRHPIWWIDTTFVEYSLDSPGPGRTIRIDPNTPTTAHRSVWPPLRAWAAGRDPQPTPCTSARRPRGRAVAASARCGRRGDRRRARSRRPRRRSGAHHAGRDAGLGT